ncbi:MAG: helix-turn-helix domain-containing protein [Clostridiales bacterium]|jgi:hypothetical protein|nr:helix-turn-helix domain-containing protein [Clostridiales bacterium]PWM23644.1 MAG: hypothetical protein DBX53_01190 [Clostridiales bacterium]
MKGLSDMIEERLHRYARPDELFCLNESIVSDPVISLHTHDFIELSYIRKGHAIHVLNGSKISVSAGDLFLLSYGCCHTFEACSRDFTYTNVLFRPQIFDESYQASPYLEDLFQIPYFADLEFKAKKLPQIHLFQITDTFEYDFKSLTDEYYKGLPGYRILFKNQLANILIKIGRAYMQISHVIAKSPGQELIQIVLDYFRHTSSFKKIRLEDIAQRVYMHPDYLAKVFKEKVGINISVFIRSIRLEAAALHLRTTNMNVCEVMRFVGYQDTKNFYKAFKSVYHMTPAKYRAKYKNPAEEAVVSLPTICKAAPAK